MPAGTCWSFGILEESGLKLDRIALAQRAQELRADPHFRIAKREFCENMTRCWLDTPLSRALISDIGTMAIAITIVGSCQVKGEDGASLQTMIDMLVAGRLASATRIRAVMDMLRDKGAIEIRPHREDGRRLTIVPTPLLLHSFDVWFTCAFGPVARLFPLPPDAQARAARALLSRRYVATVMRRKALDNFTIFDDWPDVQAFSDRRHGYVLLLHLAGDSQCEVQVSRDELARRYGVSPSHITSLLVFGERQGLLQRIGRTSAVRLAPGFVDRLDLWVAREIAIVGMWIESKLVEADKSALVANR